MTDDTKQALMDKLVYPALVGVILMAIGSFATYQAMLIEVRYLRRDLEQAKDGHHKAVKDLREDHEKKIAELKASAARKSERDVKILTMLAGIQSTMKGIDRRLQRLEGNK